MHKRLFVFLFFGLLTSTVLPAQKAWWVFFTDKNGTSFDPYSYFAPEAIERRQKLGLSLYDSTDFPVNENYLREVASRVDTLGLETRWFNGVGVVATIDQVAQLRHLPFVREVVPQQELEWIPADTTVEDFDGKSRSLEKQLQPIGGKEFEAHGHSGKGIVIAVLDAGFSGADQHPAFAHLRMNNQVRSTWDFVKNSPDVYSTRADHGTMVLSCIAGKMDGHPMGLAPDATVLLARIAREYGNQYRAEEYFVAAVEWADKQGAMLINCSGGPGVRSYFPEQMNGKIPLISRAANMSASKGMLVIAAAGNSGDEYDDRLLPPSDADSSLCVTALNDSGYVAGYSSRGPTPQFSHKPDVCAPGTAIVADKTQDFSVAEGTSFSAPLLTGFAACLLEMYPDLSPMSLADTMRRSANLYPYFDYAHGYGAPQASYFFDPQQLVAPTFTINTAKDGGVTVNLDTAACPKCCFPKTAYLYFSLENLAGKIYHYGVIQVTSETPLVLPADETGQGGTLHVFYRGYYASKRL
jgi:subtilisin family serine protease